MCMGFVWHGGFLVSLPVLSPVPLISWPFIRCTFLDAMVCSEMPLANCHLHYHYHVCFTGDQVEILGQSVDGSHFVVLNKRTNQQGECPIDIIDICKWLCLFVCVWDTYVHVVSVSTYITFCPVNSYNPRRKNFVCWKIFPLLYIV